MAGEDCWAITQPGSPVTVYLPGAGPMLRIWRSTDSSQVCTQAAGHPGGHSSCDGHGHILAKWPRRGEERYWHPGDCSGCDHHKQAVAVWN